MMSDSTTVTKAKSGLRSFFEWLAVLATVIMAAIFFNEKILYPDSGGKMYHNEFLLPFVHDYYWGSVAVLVVLFLALVFGMPFLLRKMPDIPIVSAIVSAAIGFAIFVAVIFTIALFIEGLARHIYAILYPIVGPFVVKNRSPSFFFAAAIGVSYIAYLFRQSRFQTLYGVVEALCGIFLIRYSADGLIFKLFTDPAPLKNLSSLSTAGTLAFLTGMYVIVRGLTNIEDGLKKGRLTPRLIFDLLLRRT